VKIKHTNMNISELAKQMQRIIENQNGTFTGGFLSIEQKNQPINPSGLNEKNCISASSNEGSCTNNNGCINSKNSIRCTNNMCFGSTNGQVTSGYCSNALNCFL
jgi:phage-related tail fiber protein